MHYLSVSERVQIAKDAIYSRTFEGLNRKQSDLVRKAIIRNIANKNPMQGVVDVLIRIGMEPAQAKNVVRTEAHEIRLTLRETAFRIADPDDKNKYMWLGAKGDRRFCEHCADVMEASKKGVSLDELKHLVREAARKACPDLEPRDWTVHPGDRCSAVRHFGG
jgi:hypothetical protein